MNAAPSGTHARLQIKVAVDVVMVKGEKSVVASKRGNAMRQGLDYRPVSTTYSPNALQNKHHIKIQVPVPMAFLYRVFTVVYIHVC